MYSGEEDFLIYSVLLKPKRDKMERGPKASRVCLALLASRMSASVVVGVPVLPP
jgi:hypothetical protein